MTSEYVLIAGNISSGLSFYGPFPEYFVAEAYAAEHDFGEFQVCELVAPDQEDDQ